MAVVAASSRFGLPEVKRALFPVGAFLPLNRRVPPPIAMELALTGEAMHADRAFVPGLVNRGVPREEVLDEALALAEEITANGPLAVHATKRLLRTARTQPPEEVWALEAELQPGLFDSEDAREGALAFIERRPAVWRGR